MQQELFSHYAATSQSVRDSAHQVRSRVDPINALHAEFGKQYDGAAKAVDGYIWPVANPLLVKQTTMTTDVSSKLVWAAAQLELFADAIDTYNIISAAPRCIDKLNEAYRVAVNSVSDPTQTSYPQVISNLRSEYAQLGANLDHAAASVKSNLSSPPTIAQLQQAWEQGYLPSYAPELWPGVDFNSLPLEDVPADIGDLNDQQLAWWIHNHPDLNPAILARLGASRSVAVAMANGFTSWQLNGQGNLYGPQYSYPNLNYCPTWPDGYGVLIGPDGRSYSVHVAVNPPCTSPSGCLMPQTPNPVEPGWIQLGNSSGQVELGNPIDLSARVAFVLAGGELTEPIGDIHSVGSNPKDYIHVDGNNVWTGEVEAAEEGLKPQTGFPPEPGATVTNAGKHATNDVLFEEQMRTDDASKEIKYGGSVEVLSNMLQGLGNSEVAKADKTYVYNVVWEQSEAGERRAVVQLYQVVHDSDTGETYLTYTPGTIAPNGDITPPPHR